VRGPPQRDDWAHGARKGATGGGSPTASMRRGWQHGNPGTKGVAVGKVIGGGAHRSGAVTLGRRKGSARLRSNGGDEASMAGDGGGGTLQ
jgi:hypothetical protein